MEGAMTSYRARFETLIAELEGCPELEVTEATIGSPTPPDELEAARAVAGAAWPEGMTELYTELSQVDVAFRSRSEGGPSGAIHIPTVTNVWDHAAHEDELWFNWCEPNSPLLHIRPIDRFVPEAYAVLYPVPGDRPAMVHYHYCGESLVPTSLSYQAWLEQLFKARGVNYWLKIFTGPRRRMTWVEERHDAMARLFPDFDPIGASPSEPFAEIPV
jgi:hypothetical protein